MTLAGDSQTSQVSRIKIAHWVNGQAIVQLGLQPPG